jgi:hypothetical protein
MLWRMSVDSHPDGIRIMPTGMADVGSMAPT